jgi:ADP-heptose:LPS heptosyltransferase
MESGPTGRAVRERITRLVAACLPVRAARGHERTAPRCILLIRTDRRIGNLVTITSLFEPLRHEWPAAAIQVIAAPPLCALLAPDPLISKVIPFDRSRVWRRPVGALQMIRKLRRANYDIVFNVSHSHCFSTTDGLLTRATGAPLRIGFARGAEAACSNILVAPPSDADRRPRPAVYRDLLLPLIPRARAPVSSPRVRLVATRESQRAGEDWWGTDAPRVLVHTGGRGSKRWPTAHFLTVAEHVARQGYCVAVTGDPTEWESLREAVRRPAGSTSVRIAPVLSLADFVGLVGAADMFIGADAGPTHIAAGVGVPRVVVFLEDRAWEWAYGDDCVALYAPGGPNPSDVVAAALRLANGHGHTLLTRC